MIWCLQPQSVVFLKMQSRNGTNIEPKYPVYLFFTFHSVVHLKCKRKAWKPGKKTDNKLKHRIYDVHFLQGLSLKL